MILDNAFHNFPIYTHKQGRSCDLTTRKMRGDTSAFQSKIININSMVGALGLPTWMLHLDQLVGIKCQWKGLESF